MLKPSKSNPLDANMNPTKSNPLPTDKIAPAKANPKTTPKLTPVKQALQNHLIFSSFKTIATATNRDWYDVSAYTVRDHVRSEERRVGKECA